MAVTALELIVRDEIRDRGPMRFDRYMELALYHPGHGYYRAGRRIGRAGDFMTSVSVGPLFGNLLARQAAQMWRLLECPHPFRIVEQGAHDGQLAIDILEACRAGVPDFFKAIRYRIIEPAGPAREIQRRQFTKAELDGVVDWIDSLEEKNEESFAGIFLSNELVDAFPVRLIRRQQGAWNERYVSLGKDDLFSWEDIPAVDLESVIRELPLPTLDGYTTEISLNARTWMSGVAKLPGRGYVLTIDYGFPASVYYAPFRIAGTLTTYRAHRRNDDVLLLPGESDITAHVDFTALAQTGEANGLATLGLVDQQRFLMGVAHDELSGTKSGSPALSDQVRAWHMLTHPDHFGARFQVLVQAKDAPGGLDGLRYARAGGLD